MRVLTLTLLNSYEGTYVNGLKIGNGKYTWDSGKTYEGQWRGDMKCGFGTMKVRPCNSS